MPRWEDEAANQKLAPGKPSEGWATTALLTARGPQTWQVRAAPGGLLGSPDWKGCTPQVV